MPRGSYRQVMNGTATRTSGGLTAKDLERRSDGNGGYRIVSRKKSAVASRNFGKTIGPWNELVSSVHERKGGPLGDSMVEAKRLRDMELRKLGLSNTVDNRRRAVEHLLRRV
eukprot:jgi/Mesvir1/12/Mv19990-RA.1